MARKWKAAGSANAADTAPREINTMYDQARHGLPPAGPYRVIIRRIEATESRNGNPMLRMLAIIRETGVKADYSGYVMFPNVLATEEWEDYMNQFLTAIAGGEGKTAAAVRKAFWSDAGPRMSSDGMVTQIGPLKIPEKGFELGVNTRKEPAKDGYDAKTVVSAFFTADKLGDEPIDAEDVEPEEELEEEPEEVEEASDEEPEEEGTDREAFVAELEAQSIVELRKIARSEEYPEIDNEETKGKNKAALIEMIADAVFSEASDEDADEEEEPEEEEEEEEEPPARPTRPTRATSKSAAKTTKATRPNKRRDAEVPF